MAIYKSFDKKQRLIIAISIILALLGIIAGIIYDSGLANVELTTITRPQSYGEAENISFGVEVEGMDEGEDLSYEGQVGVKRLEEEKINDYLNRTLDTLEATMYREGEAKNRVMTGLNIPARLENNPVDISFSTDEGGILHDNGDINFEMIKEKKDVTIKLIASYREKEASRTLVITIYPKTLTADEKIKLGVKESLDKALTDGENDTIILPTEIEGRRIRAFFPKEEITGNIVGIALATIICLFAVFNENNKRRIREREEELKNGYTEFVGRFVILLGAGLSISAIWKKLETGFASNKSLTEEIRLTLWEVGNGKTEREAYENFGKRIGGTQYSKFVSVINQSLKLGSGQLLSRLEAESEAAMFERRNKAKVMGEVADTKLLMPMMLQLVLIMLIIMVPALLAV